MTLLVVLLVLWLRHTGKFSEPAELLATLLRRWRDIWIKKSANEGWPPTVSLLLVLLPPSLLIGALMLSLYDTGYGLWNSAVGFVVLLVILLDHPRPDILQREQNAWLEADERHADLFEEADPLLMQQAAHDELARARHELLRVQVRVLFAPLFWFLLAGPVAAVFYYFLRLLVEDNAQTDSMASRLLQYADWPVARVMALCFALAGNFSSTWQYWRDHALVKDRESLPFLEASALCAQPQEETEYGNRQPGIFLGQELAAIDALMQRVLVIWLVFLALHTLWP